MAAIQQDINQLLKVRREKLAALQEAGRDPFQITKYDVTHHSQEIHDGFDALEGKTVSVAGRVMSKRVMGKASFCNVQDLEGRHSGLCGEGQRGRGTLRRFQKI